MHHKKIRAAILGAVVALCLPAQAQLQAQLGHNVLDGGSARAFLPVYAHYVTAIQEHGLDGFKRQTAPGFTVRHGRDHWTGAAAFAQADVWLHGIQGGKVAVTIRSLTITDRTAVALTEESFTFRLAPNENGTGTVYLKQTWRQLGKSWKLASQEWVSEAAESLPPTFEYTVSTYGGSVQTGFKQFITKP